MLGLNCCSPLKDCIQFQSINNKKNSAENHCSVRFIIIIFNCNDVSDSEAISSFVHHYEQRSYEYETLNMELTFYNVVLIKMTECYNTKSDSNKRWRRRRKRAQNEKKNLSAEIVYFSLFVIMKSFWVKFFLHLSLESETSHQPTTMTIIIKLKQHGKQKNKMKFNTILWYERRLGIFLFLALSHSIPSASSSFFNRTKNSIFALVSSFKTVCVSVKAVYIVRL